jgi:high-affinity Fe2+/Pb2+ permease
MGAATEEQAPAAADRLLVFEFFAGAVALAALVGLLIYALLRASQGNSFSMVTLSLSVITLVALMGAILVEADYLATLAGTGAGALATGLTAMLDHRRDPPDRGGRHRR